MLPSLLLQGYSMYQEFGRKSFLFISLCYNDNFRIIYDISYHSRRMMDFASDIIAAWYVNGEMKHHIWPVIP